MTHQDDTQPKPPAELRKQIEQSMSPLDSSQLPTPTRAMPPVQADAVEEPRTNSIFSCLMMSGVLTVASLLCLVIVALAGIAGVRDEVNAIGTESAQDRLAEAQTQYASGLQELENENYDMASIRFSAVETAQPNYQDAAARLADVQLILSATPTPQPATAIPTLTPDVTEEVTTPEFTATPRPTDDGQLSAAELYGLAESAMVAQNFEEAIDWFDALVLVDSNYRRSEVAQQRLNAHLAQARIYLRGQNSDGEDRLSQGVQLIYRANELGEVPGELQYEADFVARYLAARSYLEGGATGEAANVLSQLCEEDCDWSYRGVSVRQLLSQSGGVAP